MAKTKVDRAIHGPSWTEVILGAVLSLILGVALGAALLILKPVKQVRELPKEGDRDSSLVYYVEGSRDGSKAKQALAKRQAFVAGKSVQVTEEEVNSLVGGSAAPATPPPAAPKAGDKKGAEKAAEKAAAAAGDLLATGTPNVRIRDNVLQIGVPVTVGLMGLEQKVIVFGRGKLVKGSDGYVYEPDELYLGSCPVQRLPFLSGYVRNKFLAATPIPEDIATAWKKVTDATIEGNTLKLTL